MVVGNKKDVIVGKFYQYFRPEWKVSITAEIVIIDDGEIGVVMDGSSYAVYMDSIPEDALFSEYE